MQGNTGECRGMQRDAEECSREMQRNAKGYKGGVHMEEDRKVSLSDGEWRIMNLLWENPPQTIMELVRALKKDTGWSKNTVITMLNRLEAKSAV